MSHDPAPSPTSDEYRKARASNRRIIIALGVIVVGLCAPALYRVGRYLIGLL